MRRIWFILSIGIFVVVEGLSLLLIGVIWFG